MPTLRQKKLAKNIVENSKRDKPLNKQELVVSSGYGEISAKSSAHIILEQKGVQEALSDLGFTEDGAKKVVQEIMYNPKVDANSRLKATDQVFKVHGSYAPEKTASVNLEVKGDIKDFQELEAVRIKYEEELKTKFLTSETK